jgi:hypothetical protein
MTGAQPSSAAIDAWRRPATRGGGRPRRPRELSHELGLCEIVGSGEPGGCSCAVPACPRPGRARLWRTPPASSSLGLEGGPACRSIGVDSWDVIVHIALRGLLLLFPRRGILRAEILVFLIGPGADSVRSAVAEAIAV